MSIRSGLQHPVYWTGNGRSGGKVKMNSKSKVSAVWISRLALAGALSWMAMACGDAQGPGSAVENPPPPPPPPPSFSPSLIVSNPGAAIGTTRSPLRGGSAAVMVYASMPPGSVPDGERIVIQNRRTGAQATAKMVNGGVDPFQVMASAGDTLDIRISLIGDGGVRQFISLVPLHRPPVVVRTDPPARKLDVPLNAIIVVVFSEPIDPAKLDSSTVQLLLGGLPVAGTLAFAGTENLVVNFTPAQPLIADTSYSVLVTQGIEDLSGDALPADVIIPFGTGSALTGGAGIYLAGADGLGVSWLVRGNRPAWSPDGQRIAFDRLGEIYVVNTDGTNEVRLTQGTEPAWSPDGGSIVFAGARGISVINLSTRGTRTLISPGFDPRVSQPWGLSGPDWSPDGSRIAFVNHGDERIPAQIYVMNADGSGLLPMSNIPGVMYAESDPSWSADGAWIVYWSYGLGIAYATPLGGGQTSVYLNSSSVVYGARPDFSPDWETILFSGINRNIYTVSRDGGVPSLLIPNAYHGTWSPDGARIAFVRGTP